MLKLARLLILLLPIALVMTCRTSCAKRIPRRAASRKPVPELNRGTQYLYPGSMLWKYVLCPPISRRREARRRFRYEVVHKPWAFGGWILVVGGIVPQTSAT
jgi:hypothetical protein